MCLQGINWCAGKPREYPGALYDRLEKIYDRTGDRMAKAASLADGFFNSPSENGFFDLVKAAVKLKLGKPVAALARHFLETGEEPSPGEETSGEVWPLPPPEAPPRDRGYRRGQPRFDVLTDIAIREKKPDEILKWYDADNQRDGRLGRGATVPDTRVADAVRRKYPERAIAIWKELAQQQINQVNVRGYEAAVPFIRKVRDSLLQRRKVKEWEKYFAQLKAENRRRPRCMELLERIAESGKRILD